VIFTLHGQNSNNPPPEPKGLVVTSTVLDPTTRQLTVGLQNTFGKTIAGYALHYLQLDASGKTVSEYGEGQDLLDLNGSSRCIQPGQPIGIRAARQADNRSVVSVLVEVIAVIYLDRTYEGIGGVIFDHRMNKAADIRKSIAGQSHTPAEKTRLENEAAFWENAALPQEAQ
jgi:hypothetical protein